MNQLDHSVLFNPSNPFTVWALVVSYGILLGYLGYLLWRYRKGL